jgi:hypothetical protein
MLTKTLACTANFEWILVHVLAALIVIYPLLRLG